MTGWRFWGLPVPVLYIEMEGYTGPVVRSELEGRKGRTEEQPPRNREVKLGCVFTQTAIDETGQPIRDEASTTHVGEIEVVELGEEESRVVVGAESE